MNSLSIKHLTPLFVAAGASLAVFGGAQQGVRPGGGQTTRVEGFTVPSTSWFDGGSLQAIPELSKKMNRIMALREIVRVGLTRQDIQAALPTLKSLRDAEKAMRSASEKVLDEEEKALFAAEPANVPKEDSGKKIRAELEKYRKTEGDAWRTIEGEIGRQKTLSLRMLLGSYPFTLFQGSGFGGGNPFWFDYGDWLSPTAPTPGGRPGSHKGDDSPVPPGPQADPSLRPVNPVGPPSTQPALSSGANPGVPGTPPVREFRPGADPMTQPVAPQAPTAQDPTAQPGKGAGGAASPVPQDPTFGGGQGRSGGAWNPFGTQSPTFGSGQGSSGNQRNPFGSQDPTARRFSAITVQPGMQINLSLPRLNLSELIDLLEQRQGALKK